MHEHTMSIGALEIDRDGRRARLDGTPLKLTRMEFRLLEELALHPGEALSRATLLEQVWGCQYLGDSRLVDMAVTRLRTKLGDDPAAPRFLATVRGVGYRFDGISAPTGVAGFGIGTSPTRVRSGAEIASQLRGPVDAVLSAALELDHALCTAPPEVRRTLALLVREASAAHALTADLLDRVGTSGLGVAGVPTRTTA